MNLKKFASLAVAIVVLVIAANGCAKKQEASLPEDTLPPIELFQPGQATTQTQIPMQFPAQQEAAQTVTVTPVPVQEPVSEEEKRIFRNKEIQQALKNANFYTGDIDGKIGPMTRKAIRDFQRSKGLVVDGKVGPKTWGELEKYLVGPEAATQPSKVQ